ncbi:acylphosphatase [Anabaena cylindrica FACHB-243]|uniref:acylphosphatase n=1 Tax=Anabaena cylindrica (strain ATCC 27899 / PCC 7122) TaxID=272123 RepID=K9ZKD1_ANACC|nr:MULTISPECIES: acylphosphatase [Anabaena]AFZ59688.1 Acylphosphatase [Anabaena cylindrica PCC 7122]MBD2418650.1 acylphosphatase [Anabaena cylindrica FACHB-243]MBY5283393.1 acylphosphatase [Anabaena sp. CCAP 1446/1C]MBY5307752.1 acylphosphatase [Anabaena sp. CCAP 1446/1C]MCM2406212.1 acylphosphatase [Anabaena sp. CCAP 1446/1C]
MQNSTLLPKLIRAHVLITGRVQGVGYRYATLDTASQLGLTGWVRNLPDNQVEAVFEGVGEVVEEMVRWCHIGPPAAVVKNVVVEYEQPEGLRRFEVL